MEIEKESFLMRQLRRAGLDSLAWPLRRLYCPVKKDDLVLEVGSGGNPYYRANVLCDAYLETGERFFEKLVADRPIILAMTEDLPFKDGVFDFVIASHVLEHSKDPVKFISELQRVGKAGYIEVPDAFMERLCPYSFHALEITDIDNRLVINRKKDWVQDRELLELLKNKVAPIFGKIISKNPFHFHVRYYWSKDFGGIKYKITNPEERIDLPPVEAVGVKISPAGFNPKVWMSKVILSLARRLLSQNARNKKISLRDYLVCLRCRGSVSGGRDGFVCDKCSHSYRNAGMGIPDFTK